MKLKCKTIKKIPLLASLAFLVGCTTVPEPKPFNSDVDKYAYVKEYMRWYINEQMKDNNIVGMSVALVDDQKIVWQEGFGYEDKAKGIKATPQTRYRAGSITKLFNAMAVMKLVEEKKMNIDMPLKKYLPEFSIRSRFGAIDGITPRNIMTHHSGLPGDWVDRMFATRPLPYTEHVKVIKDEYVAYAPNTIFSYSNLGTSLLGHSVEKVSGMKYSEYVDKVLFRPLEMYNSNLDMALEGKNASKSYKEGKEVNEYAIGKVPAGALNTSVEELAHLAMMINANGMYKNHRVLKPSTLDKMFTVQNKEITLDVGQEIGLGYFIDTTFLNDNEPIYSHDGGTVAHRSQFSVAHESKLGIVVMANSSTENVSKIARELMKKAWESKTGKKVKTKSLTVEHKSNFSGVYSTMLGKVTIKEASKDSYTVQTENATFDLYKTKNGSYKLKYKLLGFIPIGDDELDKVELYTDEINGNHVIIVSMVGKKMIGGVKVEKQSSIPKKWTSYVGKYTILNNLEPKDWKIMDVEFVIEEGYLLLKTKLKSGELSTMIFKPMNDTEAILEGLGRGMKETLYFKEDVFHFRGLRFKKVEEEK